MAAYLPQVIAHSVRIFAAPGKRAMRRAFLWMNFVLRLLRLKLREPCGNWFRSRAGDFTTWRAARCPELKPKLEPASIKEYAGPPRPPDTSLNCTKAERLLGRPLAGLKEW